MAMHLRPDASRAGLLFGGLALALVLSGCPDGADLENPDAWAGRFGTAGTGVAMGGSAGTGGMPPGVVLNWTTVTCDASFDMTSTTLPASADFMTKTCARQFCHGQGFVAGLDLRTDDGFAKRVKDVQATHGDISCADDPTKICVPASCPPKDTVKLVDSQDPTMSWIMTKAIGGPGVGGADGCGDPMPSPSGLTTDLQKQCLMNIVTAVAALK
jgi:hypothetical protein